MKILGLLVAVILLSPGASARGAADDFCDVFVSAHTELSMAMGRATSVKFSADAHSRALGAPEIFNLRGDNEENARKQEAKEIAEAAGEVVQSIRQLQRQIDGPAAYCLLR